MSHAGPIKVYAARDEPHARIALAALAAEGIQGCVMGTPLQTAQWDLGVSFNALPRIWVEAADAPRAREILERFDRESAARDDEKEEAPAWTCPACGETVEGSFDACWSCETRRPDPAA